MCVQGSPAVVDYLEIGSSARLLRMLTQDALHDLLTPETVTLSGALNANFQWGVDEEHTVHLPIESALVEYGTLHRHKRERGLAKIPGLEVTTDCGMDDGIYPSGILVRGKQISGQTGLVEPSFRIVKAGQQLFQTFPDL